MTTKWSGRQVTVARAQWQVRIDGAGGWPCCRCGRVIAPRQPKTWQVDHWPVPREMGGTQTAPAHATCNLSAGGKRGAEITNARRKPPERTDRLEKEPLRW